MSSSINLSTESSGSENWHCNINALTVKGRPKSTLISLSLPSELQRPHLLSIITECTKDNLKYPTVAFETQVADHSHPDVVEKVANWGDVFVSSIQVSDVDESLFLIDHLFQQQLMSETDKSNIENSLNSLDKLILPSPEKASVSTAPELTDSEKQIHDIFSLSPAKLSEFKVLPARWSNLSSPRVDTITLAQKQIIELSVANSIGIIKKNIEDVEILQNLLESPEMIFNSLPHYDILSITGWLQLGTRDYLGFSNGSNPISLEEEKEFYQNVVQLSLIYYSRANLEETLLKLGAGLPSEEKIQETILNFFENYRVG